ncbi:hypothetical protein [Aquimarina algiphila]|uniref:hypothetical protein n=1 Tax=Aquimarina algiphila TaxID=2047982 RepID=UPI00232A9F0F|nr:hypothetical protein [Aquimarina algiphila]
MKTERLKNKFHYILTFALIITLGSINAQVNKANVTIVIDNKIITSGLSLEFINTDSKEKEEFSYHLGKELSLPNKLFANNNLIVKFSYLGSYKKHSKDYKYEFNFKKGWLHNTDYLIIRIYNLDKKKFKKVFCEEKLPYGKQIQNAVYLESKILCKPLKIRI